MQPEALLFVRIVFGTVFLVTLLAGAYMFRNWDRLFGVDPTVPSDTSGSRTYNATQVVVIWLHVLLFSGAFALGVH